jgi:hypothetical protein
MTKRFFLLCLLALAALADLSAAAQTHPNFSGTWKLHQDASSVPSDAPRDTVLVIDHNEPRFKYSATGKRGLVPFSEVFEFTTDGRPPAEPSKLSVAANWEGQTLIMKYLKGGTLVATVRIRCSPDGKHMVREADFGANRKVRETYDRQ